MVKQGLMFDRAWQFDAAMLARPPAVCIKPTLEYDAKPHPLSGPLLSTVVGVAGVFADAKVSLAPRALERYTVAVSLADARSYRMTVATALDGTPLALGGLARCGRCTTPAACRPSRTNRSRSASRCAPGACIASK